VSTQLSKLSQKEKEIEDCVEQAKKDVTAIERKIQSKQNEIRILGEVL
jgi:peptidoglycan hydrolase CwlO-like protein